MNTPMRFMVVDDDPENNNLCKLVIYRSFANCDIKVFSLAPMALEFIQSEYSVQHPIPTILFLDINMPGMNGWEFLQRFNRYDEAIKNQFNIFILSSSEDTLDKEKAIFTSHVDQYIPKPISKDKLNQILTHKKIDKKI